MLSGMDLTDEILSFPFEDVNDGIDDGDFSRSLFFSFLLIDLDPGLQNVLDDPSLDFSIFNMPDEALPEAIVDTSDSDSGISSAFFIHIVIILFFDK